jgi:hypothetical protein
MGGSRGDDVGGGGEVFRGIYPDPQLLFRDLNVLHVAGCLCGDDENTEQQG